MSEEFERLKKEYEDLKQKELEIDSILQLKRQIEETKGRIEQKTKKKSSFSKFADNISNLSNKDLGI